LLNAGSALLPDQPEQVRGWLARLAKAFAAEDGAGVSHPSVEELLLGGPRRYSRAELLAGSTLDRDLVVRIWRSMGFADVDDDEVFFTEGDREALDRFERLRAEGALPTRSQEAIARAVGQAMVGLADWQVEVLADLLFSGSPDVDEDQARATAARILPLIEQMQNYVWRRHLAAAAARLLPALGEHSETRDLVVGFADMVEFTRLTRQISPSELTDLIDEFQAVTAEVVTGRHGRVVKHVGDEVMYTAERPETGADIAIELMERVAVIDGLPRLRIGMASGPVVSRFGDVYGEAVNVAARLTAHGKPGRILVDRAVAEALTGSDEYRLKARRLLKVHGYRHLPAWRLTRAADRKGG
jgi:adenylate cyclase